jgi:hypothetical protein
MLINMTVIGWDVNSSALPFSPHSVSQIHGVTEMDAC